jgi:SAM-dependent methyltransferase
MRTTLLKFLGDLTASTRLPEPIYEFGSYRVPGQQHLPWVRDYFPGRRFVGCDLRPGPGVDEVQDLHGLAIPDGTVGTALLFDTIEHVRDPWKALSEVHRCLAPGGILVMTSVWYFPIHAYPDDYWRFTSSGFSTLFKGYDEIAVTMCGLSKLPHTVVGVASKGAVVPETAAAIRKAVEGWKADGAHSWKETVMELMPPRLLIPTYAAYLRVMALVHPRHRQAAAQRAADRERVTSAEPSV